MKCEKCGFEWNEKSAKVSLKMCPICGEKIISGKKKDKEINTLSDVIDELIDVKGKESLSDKKMILSMFSDVAPHLIVEKNQLQMVMNCNVWDKLLSVKGENASVQIHAISRARATIEALGIRDDIASELIDSICHSFEFNDDCFSQIIPNNQAGLNDAPNQNFEGKKDQSTDKDLKMQWKVKFKEAEERRDYDASLLWSKIGAIQGDAEAQCYFAVNNKDFWKCDDLEEEIEWLKKSAAQGNAEAQYYLGSVYLHGMGGADENLEEAFKLFQESARQGYEKPIVYLAICFERGYGVERDLNEAEKWYRKGAEQESAFNYNFLSSFYDNSQMHDKLEKCAMELFENVKSKELHCFALGLDWNKNYKEAAKWFRKAAEIGSSDSQCRLGDYYLEGKGGLEKDPKEAMKWYRKAAEQGDYPAKRL